MTSFTPKTRGWICIVYTVAVIVMAALLSAVGAEATGVGQGNHLRAHATRVLSATDTAKLRYVRSSGSRLYEEGSVTGTLPGKMTAYVNIGSTISATFTIYVHGGTIKGRGSAIPHGSGIYESFAGSATAVGGTGRYVHAHGRAGLYGVFNRRTYALTVQTTGRLSY
jgi:hypothetical protein